MTAIILIFSLTLFFFFSWQTVKRAVIVCRCGWCEKPLGWKFDPSFEGGVSHGICLACRKHFQEHTR